MKIIVSPTMKMRRDFDTFEVADAPIYLDQARKILAKMKTLSYDQAKDVWQTSEALATANYNWLQKMDLDQQQSPAILSYSGVQYKYMSPDVFSATALLYAEEHLRILSGFYGVLKPMDGVVPYRLELKSDLSVTGAKNLYEFWGDQLYTGLKLLPEEPIINLASEEYAKAIRRYLKPDDQFIDVIFATDVAGKLQTKATLAKMARGQMARYMAENHVESVDGIKKWDDPRYNFNPDVSTPTRLVFVEDPNADPIRP